MKRITIIAAVSLDDGLALDGAIPWDEPADRARFARCTRGGTVIMGRITWQSLPGALPHRDNFVISAQSIEGVRCFTNLSAAIDAATGPVWLIGGTRIYEAGYALADAIDLTRVPVTLGEAALRMPPIPSDEFEAMPHEAMPEAPHLKLERWTRRTP